MGKIVEQIELKRELLKDNSYEEITNTTAQRGKAMKSIKDNQEKRGNDEVQQVCNKKEQK